MFRVTRSTFSRTVTLVKDNPVLQGKNVDKQSKHFVPEVHLLANLKFLEQKVTKMVPSIPVDPSSLRGGCTTDS
jgi:hypothetical protein